MPQKPSAKSISKVIFKPSTQSTDEYTVVVNVEEVCLNHPSRSMRCTRGGDADLNLSAHSTTSGKQEVCDFIAMSVIGRL